MLATLVIVFREIFEAALIIGIVAAATKGVPRRGLWIVAGVGAGVTGAIVVAALADVIVAWADGMGQEVFNASILGAAVCLLGWHNIWMASHSRELVQEMRQVGAEVSSGDKTLFALLMVVAIAVLREGSEIVLFLYGQSVQGVGLAQMATGFAGGVAAGAAAGAALYLGLLRIPTRHLFRVTGWMILLLAAGMASQAAKFLVQADMLPAWGTVWDISRWLSNESLVGRLLHTLIGYEASPLGMQVVTYLSTLTLIGVAMKRVESSSHLPAGRSAVALAAIAVLPLAIAVSPAAKASPSDYIYSPHVVNGETEIEFNGGYYGDSDSAVDHSRGHTIGIGRGMNDNWFSEVELGWDKQGGGGVEYAGAEWVNIYEVTEPGKHLVDFSMFSELDFNDHSKDPNTIEIGPMFEKEFGATVNNLNLTWVRDYGSHATHTTTFEYAWQTRIKGDPLFEYGLQAMGDLGEWSDMHRFNGQEHKIGPAVFGDTRVGNGSDHLKYNGALLLGLTGATPDYTLRFTVEYEIY